MVAILARSGLLRGGFVPPANFRHLRLVSRQMQKLTRILAGEKNRIHKVLTDGGFASVSSSATSTANRVGR